MTTKMSLSFSLCLSRSLSHSANSVLAPRLFGPGSHLAAPLITQCYMSYCIINARQQHEPVFLVRSGSPSVGCTVASRIDLWKKSRDPQQQCQPTLNTHTQTHTYTPGVRGAVTLHKTSRESPLKWAKSSGGHTKTEPVDGSHRSRNY